MKNLVRLEELLLALLAVFLFRDLDYAWWWFPLLLLAPDLGMVGYLAGPRVGAFTYNLLHHKAVAVTAYIAGALVGSPVWQLIGLIILAHSSLDRVLGYGLKHPDSFKHTHLGMIGGTGLIALLVIALAACGGTVTRTDEPYAITVEPASFGQGVDNPYFPLQPGTTLVYEGETPDGLERIEDAVTHDTKQILGVTCVVVRNTVTLDGEIIEDTLDWYAQDREGNVWYFGEDTKEYENGAVVRTAGSWEAGVDGALPGIIMKANPRVEDTYRQEYYPGEAEDMAEVLSLNEAVTVANGAYQNVLKTKEWTPLEPGIAEHKYYARGIGLVLEEIVEGGSGRIELVEIVTE